jgi:hypothetical protein
MVSLFNRALSVSMALLLAIGPTIAAEYCVRKGASGANTGLNWTDAFPDTPATWSRADSTNRYWYADSDAGAYTYLPFPNAMSGANTIVVKKAYPSAPGMPTTGWVDSYGNGTATLGSGTGGISFNDTGYIIVDGYSPTATENMGFIIPLLKSPGDPVNYKGIYVGDFSVPQTVYLTVKYLDIQGPDTGGDDDHLYYEIGQNTWGVYGVSFAAGYRYITFDHVKISRVETLIQVANMDDFTIQNSELSYSRQANPHPLAPHANVLYMASCDNLIFRNNKVHHWAVTGIYPSGSEAHTGYEIYGNRFYKTYGNSASAIWVHSGTLTDAKVYNNTFADMNSPLTVDTTGAGISGGPFQNNILYNNTNLTTYLPSYFNKSYNWFSGGTTYGSSSIAGGSTNPFTSSATYDFSLVNELPGTSLASQYDLDPNDQVRSDDGVWSMGALDFGGGSPSIPPTISDEPDSQTISSGNAATMTVVASGTPVLTYQWYEGSSGTTTTLISGATSGSYTTPTLTSTTQYWVRVSNVYGTDDSATATITVSSGGGGGGGGSAKGRNVRGGTVRKP